MPVSVRAVASRRELAEFIRLPARLHRDNPLFVAPLLSERRRFFSPDNPIFQFTDVAYFLARDDRGRLLGRVTAHVNRRHNEFHNERAGFFGFLEAVNDHDVARALLDAAADWLRQRGMTLIRGPFNFSTNEECGLLVHGFDMPPVLMMPYTPPYYLEFMRRLGFTKAKDLYAWDYAYQGAIPQYLTDFSRRLRERGNITVRPINTRRFDDEVRTIFSIYNAAWEKNWGFVPATEEEFLHSAADLKAILDPALALIAETEGRPVAFSLALPDYNIVFKKMRGRLLPFGFLHFLFGKRAINRCRVLTMGVIAECRRRGIDMLLYHDTFVNGLKRGYFGCEMSWILEDNALMNKALERMGARLYKTYRIFEKPL